MWGGGGPGSWYEETRVARVTSRLWREAEGPAGDLGSRKDSARGAHGAREQQPAKQRLLGGGFYRTRRRGQVEGQMWTRGRTLVGQVGIG